MSTKNIELVIPPRPAHFVGDGFKVHNFIPSSHYLSMQRMSPFIMMDYNAPTYFPPTDTPRGVGVHPHRGFETVTIAYQGKVAHHDSSGNSGVIEPGEVQWMTAASGILHKEYHEKKFSEEGGNFQMVQLWVNLPAKDKMSPPKYQGLTKNNIQTVNLPNNGGSINVVAGEYLGTKGAASTFTSVYMLDGKLNNGGIANFKFPSHYNTAVLVIEGEVKVNNSEVAPTDHFVLMDNDGENFTVEGIGDAKILVLSGEPINEPIAAQGPFVMNTREEIMQAIQDYNIGKFGFLED